MYFIEVKGGYYWIVINGFIEQSHLSDLFWIVMTRRLMFYYLFYCWQLLYYLVKANGDF